MNDSFYAAFRNGARVYSRRPPANCRSARKAWDILAKDGEIDSMHLLDGLWMCQRPDGSLDDVEATLIR